MDHFNLRHKQNLINMEKQLRENLWTYLNAHYIIQAYIAGFLVYSYSVSGLSVAKRVFSLRQACMSPPQLQTSIQSRLRIIQVCFTLMLQKGVTRATMRTLLRSPSWSVFRDLECSYCSTAQIYYGLGS